MKTNTRASKQKKKSSGNGCLVILVVLVLLVGGCVYYCYQEFFKKDTTAITVVSTIDGYPYYLNSNATRVYKKYYKLLEEEVSDSKIDEENYVTLLAQLFLIDFYTLDNKLTNQDVGGIQFVASSLQERFKTEAINTVYKYVQNNLSGKRKQNLPEVKKVTIEKVENVSYEEGDFLDKSAFEIEASITYVEKLGYADAVKLYFVHEDNLLVLVQIKNID